MKKIHYFVILAALLLVILIAYMWAVPAPDTSKYIGVEIGASGTKCALFTVENKKYSIDTMFSDDRGTLYKAFSQNKIGNQNIEILVNLVKGALSSIPKNNAPDKNKYIVISSYFNNAIDKTILIEELKKEFKDYKVEQLNSVQEGTANFKTITELKKFPYNSNEILAIDISSGQLSLSTGGNAVFTRALNIGTKATANEIDPSDSLSSEEFECKIFNHINSDIKKVFDYNVDFTKKEKIIFTGGIAYRICCENNLLEQQLPSLAPPELSKFKANLKVNKLSCQQPSYTSKQLLCGSTIIQCLQKHIGTKTNRSYYDFDRHTWIPGFIIDQIDN